MALNFSRFERAREIELQRELFLDCFPECRGTSAVTLEHYRWKFQAFPDAVSSYEYVAHDDSRLVGYYAAIPYPYDIGGSLKRSGMVCDVMTSPASRGQGVFTKLGHYSTEQLKSSGIDFTTGYPIRKEVIPGHLKVGWKIAFPLPMYIKVLKADTLLRSRNPALLAPPVNALISVYNFLTGIPKTNLAGLKSQVLSRSEFLASEGYTAFFNMWRKSFRNVLVKDMAFMSWRTGAPGTDYKFITLRSEDAIVAVCLTRFTVLEGIPCLAILDVMVTPTVLGGFSMLEREISTLARVSGAEMIVVMMSRHCSKRYGLIRHGFLRSPRTFFLILKKLADDLDERELLQEEHWHLMWIDSDDL